MNSALSSFTEPVLALYMFCNCLGCESAAILLLFGVAMTCLGFIIILINARLVCEDLT